MAGEPEVRREHLLPRQFRPLNPLANNRHDLPCESHPYTG